MENTENNVAPSAGPGPIKKSYLLAALAGAVVVLIVAFLWLRQTQAPPSAPSLPSQTPPISPPPTAKEDSTSAINSELQALDINDLDKEFQTVDADINSL
ncbi:MAG: hypothetical protein AAB560_01950 [Patescibacteria group bacterium]